MQPKFNKLITLLLLLGTFAFLMEAEQRITSFARTNLSDWASILPTQETGTPKTSINPFAQKASFTSISLLDSLKEMNIKNN
ncbi:MAG: hypothetical protein RIM99_03795 [Cyclobacteriaceae bacterium]